MEWEYDLLYWLQDIDNIVFDRVSVFFAKLSVTAVLWIVVMLAILILVKDKRVGLTGSLALIISIVAAQLILKSIFHRDRPCWIDPNVDLIVESPNDYSFPSGHTAFSFGGATSIFLYNKKYGILALILAFIIGMSRIYLFVHFPTDVITGAVLGIVSAIISYIIVKKWYELHPDFKVPFIERG